MLYDKLKMYSESGVYPFHMPGHKRNPMLCDGIMPYEIDLTEIDGFDNLHNADGCILEVQNLAEKLYNVKKAFLLVNGATGGILSAVRAMTDKGDKVIVARNSHKSVYNALELCGLKPEYIVPKVDKEFGINCSITPSQAEKAIRENPDAKLLIITSPTYEGAVSDIKEISRIAHLHNVMVLVDEAHGTHLYFGENLPVCAMDAGADMASVSMHKSGGSLTQSSLLLTGKNVNWEYVSQIINLTQTTSASYLLMSSLDISRRNLALRGKESFAKVAKMAEYARDEINAIGGYYAYGKDLINGGSVYDFDVTKLSVYTRDIGLAGIEVYDLLRDEYDIQIELGDIANILAYISIGDRIQDIERLVGALADIKRLYSKDPASMLNTEYINPKVLVSPQSAFYSEKTRLPIRETSGRICAEFVMCYPPGIPILAPGELITDEIIEYVLYAKEKGCSMQGTEDPAVEYLNVL